MTTMTGSYGSDLLTGAAGRYTADSGKGGYTVIGRRK